MKKYFIITTIFGLLLSFNLHAEETSFVDGFEDLPLMERLVLIDDSTVSFDSPSWHFIETYADIPSDVNDKEVFHFYAQTLPQMGWRKQNENCYTREGEKLCLSISDKVLKFSLESL